MVESAGMEEGRVFKMARDEMLAFKLSTVGGWGFQVSGPQM